MGPQQLIAFLQHDLHQLVVVILILSNKDGLCIQIVCATADADGANAGRCGLLALIHPADATFKGHGEGEGRTFS